MIWYFLFDCSPKNFQDFQISLACHIFFPFIAFVSRVSTLHEGPLSTRKKKWRIVINSISHLQHIKLIYTWCVMHIWWHEQWRKKGGKGDEHEKFSQDLKFVRDDEWRKFFIYSGSLSCFVFNLTHIFPSHLCLFLSFNTSQFWKVWGQFENF